MTAIVAAALAALAGPLATSGSAAPLTGVDLSTYVRTGRFDLPEPTRTPAPSNSLLAQEASSVTYNWDTDTLFITGDGGTSIVQVTKTGQLINSMSLALGSSPQGTEFYDTEGLTYVGGGQFVITEERDRQVVRFTYVAGSTLTRAGVQTVKLGTTVGNVGLEGVTNDPSTGGLILVKEKDPESIFQTTVDWAAGTASNGSPTATGSANLFDPALIGTSDLSDVYALSNVSTLSGPDSSHLLVLSQEAGRIVNVDRSGTVSSSLTIQADPGSPLSVPDMTNEGVTMDADGTLYVVNEAGGGDSSHPQLWVYKPTDAPNLAPTGVVLGQAVTAIAENTSTQGGIKVADITVLDDGLGNNVLTVTGPDAASFQIVGGSLTIKAGTVLDHEAKSTYDVTVEVDDPTVGTSPDATTSYTLTLMDVANETAAPGTLAVTEVAPWGSGGTPYVADWFEITNFGSTPVDLAGWRMDDSSYASGSSVALRGPWNGTGADPLGSIAPGQSRIFMESGVNPTAADATILQSFSTAWWGTPAPPAGVSVGFYGGSGVGLSTGGDAVTLFNGSVWVTGVSFGSSTTNVSFENPTGVGAATNPAPAITALSSVGAHGGFRARDGVEIGSPGVDILAPSFADIPFDPTVEATGTTTPVPFTVPTATDLIDGARPVSCGPASPGPFPVGTTTVTCTASDVVGNTATASFDVVVRDTKPPVVHLPADLTVEATGESTPVTFGPVTATDVVDGELTANCSPASGSSFPIGTNHVDCSVADTRGNTGSATFNVIVTPPATTTTTTTTAPTTTTTSTTTTAPTTTTSTAPTSTTTTRPSTTTTTKPTTTTTTTEPWCVRLIRLLLCIFFGIC